MTDADSAVAPDTTAVQDEGANPTVAAGEEAATSAAGDSSLPLTIVNVDINPDNQDGGPSGPSGTTPGPIVREEVVAPADVPDDSHNLKLVVVSSCTHHVQMVVLHFLTFQHLVSALNTHN